MMCTSSPLVSVPVITYNSSKYVIETLESIKNQTYQNIELIISDDCSTDDTVAVCKEWINKNGSRFVRTIIIESPKNTGVSANVNRAERECRGEWVKGIAGDDILVAECIEQCVDFIKRNTASRFIFAKISAFGASEEYNKCIQETFFDYSFFALSQSEQLHRLIFGSNCIPASTFFYNRQAMKDLGVENDERIPMLEDWPKWINLLSKGAKFDLIDKELVRYRLRESSLSTGNKISFLMYRSMAQLFIHYQAKSQFLSIPFRYWLRKLCQANYIDGKVNIFTLYWKIYQFVWPKLFRRETVSYF